MLGDRTQHDQTDDIHKQVQNVAVKEAAGRQPSPFLVQEADSRDGSQLVEGRPVALQEELFERDLASKGNDDSGEINEDIGGREYSGHGRRLNVNLRGFNVDWFRRRGRGRFAVQRRITFRRHGVSLPESANPIRHTNKTLAAEVIQRLIK